MKLRKLYATTAAVLLGLGVAGCSAATPEPAPKPEPTKSEETVQAEEEEAAPAAPFDGDVLEPGGMVRGEPAVLPFTNHEDRTALFSHQVVSIQAASEADAAKVVEQSAQLADYDIWFINIESKYVSGEDLKHDSFFTEFKPVREDGVEVQYLALIGFDACRSNAIPSDNTEPGVVITNCVAGVTPKGSDKPAGVLWAEYDSDYQRNTGKPAMLLL